MLKPGKSQAKWDKVVTPAKPKARLYFFLSFFFQSLFLKPHSEAGVFTKAERGREYYQAENRQ